MIFTGYYASPLGNLMLAADEIGIRGDTDFQDETHLNTSGAAKLARFLSEYIIAHYNVPHTVS